MEFKKNFTHPDTWYEGWLAQDFSWESLTSKPNLFNNGHKNAQEAWRSLHNSKPDHELLGEGVLINCGQYGVYHFAFICPDWAEEIDGFPITREKLIEKQDAFWSSGHNNNIGNHFSGTISGAFLSEKAHNWLTSATGASFKWVSFCGTLRHLLKKTSRSFINCRFEGPIKCSGKLMVDGGTTPELKFSHCVITEDFCVVNLETAINFSFEFSDIRKSIRFASSTLAKTYITNCFIDKITMVNVLLEGELEISYSQLFTSVHLIDCDFRSRAKFLEMEWPAAAFNIASAEGSSFTSTTTFRSESSPPIQFFEGALFQNGLSSTSFSEEHWRTAFRRELYAVNEDGVTAGEKEQHFQTLESSCRNLRKIYERQGDVHAEHLWHRAEIITRRHRADSTKWERTFSHLYGLFADYGLSISRPFVSLVVATFLFGVVYGAIGAESWYGQSIDVESFWEGLGYSLNRALPIGVFGQADNTWREALLGSGGTVSSIAIRVVATSQSALSIVMIYLGIMAIRRKFKIS